LGEHAYGAAIRKEIEHATVHRCSIGALYTTLDRLEAKGLIKTWMGDPTRSEAAGAGLASRLGRGIRSLLPAFPVRRRYGLLRPDGDLRERCRAVHDDV
jgi:hypothetical protein